jgi:hypothetical protein
MRALTLVQTQDWCKSRGILLDARGLPERKNPDFATADFYVPPAGARHAWLARFVAQKMRPWSTCLLWVTEWTIWESSNNWPLYNRLRSAYAEERSIEDAPGHLFSDMEADDLANFLQLGLSFGWDMHVLNADGNSQLFASHDEWLRIGLTDSTKIDEIAGELMGAGLVVRKPTKI